MDPPFSCNLKIEERRDELCCDLPPTSTLQHLKEIASQIVTNNIGDGGTTTIVAGDALVHLEEQICLQTSDPHAQIEDSFEIIVVLEERPHSHHFSAKKECVLPKIESGDIVSAFEDRFSVFTKSPSPQFASTAGRIIHFCNGLLCDNHDSGHNIKLLSLWLDTDWLHSWQNHGVFEIGISKDGQTRENVLVAFMICFCNKMDATTPKVRKVVSVDWYAQKLLDKLLKKDVVMFPMDFNAYNKFVYGKLDLNSVQMMFLKGMSFFGSADIVEIYPCLSALMQALEVSEWRKKNGVHIFSN